MAPNTYFPSDNSIRSAMLLPVLYCFVCFQSRFSALHNFLPKFFFPPFWFLKYVHWGNIKPKVKQTKLANFILIQTQQPDCFIRTQLHRMSFYAVALKLPFTGTKRPNMFQQDKALVHKARSI